MERAIKRLQRDLKEWNELCHELPSIHGLPLDNNIFEWHCNILPQNGPLKGIFIHFIINFPKDYPKNPPKIKICHYVHHPNIFGSYLCLDMIKPNTQSTPYIGWTMGYSVFSIFCQLQSFIVGDLVPQQNDKIYNDEHRYVDTTQYFEKSKDRIKRKSEQFRCKTCGHRHYRPWPVMKYDMIEPKNDNDSESKSDDNHTNTGRDLFEMLYDDVEALIHAYLGLRDLFNISKVNTRWSKIIKSLNILQINKFGCWYQRIGLYTAERENIKLILGYGITPILFDNEGPNKFRLINTCKTTFDLLSHDAFTESKVRTTVWKDVTYTHWIPMYIFKNHGSNIWEYLDETILKIWGNDNNRERKMLHLIANIMNTLVVNIMNKTDEDTTLNLKDSANVLEAYIHYHHLLLAVYNEYNDILKPYIESLCTDFMHFEDERDKKKVPNLGELLIYFTLTNHGWNDICLSLLKECFVRNVKWILMTNPELIYLERAKMNCYRLSSTYNASKVSQKLFMFQSFFMRKCLDIGRTKWDNKFQEYNDNFGSPPEYLPGLLQKKCRSIHKVATWEQFFEELKLPPINPSQLNQWLKYSIIVSDKRGYHRNTKFDKIKFNNAAVGSGLLWIKGKLCGIRHDRKKCICNGMNNDNGLPPICQYNGVCMYKNSNKNIKCYFCSKECIYTRNDVESNTLYPEYKIDRNILNWWKPKNKNVQCFDKKTCRWYNAKITQFIDGFRFKVNYVDWDVLYDDTVGIFEDRIVKPDTYEIKDNKKGYFDKNDVPDDISLKSIQDEYERKTLIFKAVSRRENIKKANKVSKLIFEYAANNNFTKMAYLLQIPNEITVDEFIDIQHKIKSKKIYKMDNICSDKIKRVKAWKSPININMTDVNNRTPLFVCCYKGYYDMVTLLLNAGANVKITDKNGETVFDALNSGRYQASNHVVSIYDKIEEYLRSNSIYVDTKARVTRGGNDETESKEGFRDRNRKETYKTRTVFVRNVSNVELTTQDIDQLLGLYNLKYKKCNIRTNNTAILRIKKEYNALSAIVKQINQSVFKGSTITASMYENYVKKDKNKTGEDSVKPNKVLYIKNFDIKRGTYKKLFNILKKFGEISNKMRMGVDKFDEPYCIVEYTNIASAIKLYEYNYTNDSPLNIGDDNDLEIQYSRFNSIRKEGQIINGNNNKESNAVEGKQDKVLNRNRISIKSSKPNKFNRPFNRNNNGIDTEFKRGSNCVNNIKPSKRRKNVNRRGKSRSNKSNKPGNDIKRGNISIKNKNNIRVTIKG